MFMVIRLSKRKGQRLLVLAGLVLALGLIGGWWAGREAQPAAAWWQWGEEEIPSGNPLRVQAPLYETEGVSSLVLRLQDFYVEP